MNDYKPVIGLEIHVELKTKSKMFCSCNADYFGKKPNTHTCPVCLGLPGALPVPNEKAIEWTILIGQALNCVINKVSKFDRKHYFYPDLPKGYQISQYDEPLAVNGKLVIASGSEARYRTAPGEAISLGLPRLRQLADPRNDNKKTFRIRRVHLEEDTGKLIHSGSDTLIDFNRSGVPLVEIVTEPDFDNSDDVKKFLEELHTIICYLDVSDADMEKGSMRLEPNISLKKITAQNLPNYKVEVKNINSFRFVKQAIDFEVERQTEILEKGETPVQETRGFNEKKQATYSQRIKEEAHDYRYFPEPDIPPLVFEEKYIKEVAEILPELPQKKLERYISNFKLKPQDAFILTREKEIADYFEDVSSKLKAQIEKSDIKSENTDQDIANLIINKKIPININTDEFVKRAVEKMSVKTVSHAILDEAIDKAVHNNPKAVIDFKAGKQNALMFLVGQVMREMKGIVDANIVKEVLIKKLK